MFFRCCRARLLFTLNCEGLALTQEGRWAAR